ncbi:uncharacterized protein LOC110976741 isoform X2 [Acanthaster planci]|nr:uncharacterized protein LOC110976741 isoform X2 [Acanthaster planci]XP_022085992.1 uncharacterized protein LOC110976741 isoform X2 [Acanthaster planci]
MGRQRKARRYRLNDPRLARRDEFLATMSDFGMTNGELCFRYGNIDQRQPPNPAREVSEDDSTAVDDVDAVSKEENEKNEAAEKAMTCHNHCPLPAGEDISGTPHPDLPKGVTCITCAATIMEKGQEGGMGESMKLDTNISKTSQDTRTAEAKKDVAKELGSVSAGAISAGAEENENLTKQEKGVQGQAVNTENKADPFSGDKMSRGSRWRRRYNAHDKTPSTLKVE